MSQGIIGCEVEIYPTKRGFMMLDLNPGKVGGAKRLVGYPLLDRASSGLDAKLERMARSLTADVNDETYILFDMQTGMYKIDGATRISPALLAIQRSIEEKGHRVKGFIGRKSTFSQDPTNWLKVDLSDSGEVLSTEFDERTLEEVAATPYVYQSCHFVPTSCKENSWNEETRRNGLINNLLDLPGINWLLLREDPLQLDELRRVETPYNKAFIYSPGNRLERDTCFPIARTLDTLKEHLKDWRSEGFNRVAIKDLSKISIGGRGVSFVDAHAILEGINGPINTPALITPFYKVQPVKTSEGDAKLQIRVIYSREGQLTPEFVAAKAYSVGEADNLSGLCQSFVTWDLGDNLYFFRMNGKEGLTLVRKSPEDEKDMVQCFEKAVDSCFPAVAAIENRLQRVGRGYAQLESIYGVMKRKGMIPKDFHWCLNPFLR